MNSSTMTTEPRNASSYYHPKKNFYYFNFLTKLYRSMVPNYARVLHVGCKDGYLLHVVNPASGIGIDDNDLFIEQARNRNPQYVFSLGIKSFKVTGNPFDYIIISASVIRSYDLQELFELVRTWSTPDTKLIIDWHSYGWEPFLSLTNRAGFFDSEPFIHRLSTKLMHDFLKRGGFEVIQGGKGFLFPWPMSGFARFMNNILPLVPGFRRLGLLRWAVARIIPENPVSERSVSVIITCKNEKGNIEAAVQRCPTMGSSTELIFVEGNSHDGTLEEMQRVQRVYAEKNIKVMVQPGKGKADAVRAGFAKATGEILMILDGDLTVVPEELPRFYMMLTQRRGDFINGSRLVFSKERGSMRFLNWIANHFFRKLFCFITGQRVTDTLCGTKVLYKKDYERLAQSRAFFGFNDPFGDFDLLFGAARMQLKIIDVPVHYKARTYGTSQIHRWRDGYQLLKISLKALKRFKMHAK